MVDAARVENTAANIKIDLFAQIPYIEPKKKAPGPSGGRRAIRPITYMQSRTVQTPKVQHLAPF